MMTNLRAALVATTLAAVFAGFPGFVTGCASFEAARLYQTGTDALDSGETELAVSELERAAELLPQASEVHNHLGLAYLAAGRSGDAENAFQRAVDLDCTNAAAVRNLRVVEARIGSHPAYRGTEPR